MKKQTYIIIGILALVIFIIACFFILKSLRYMGNPTGGPQPNHPYYITTESRLVKKIEVPRGTKLTYGEERSKTGEQNKIMNEAKLTSIELPIGKTVNWAGVPVVMINKYFNSEMTGFSIYADFEHLKEDKKTEFSKLWQKADCDLGIDVKDIQDWSFNKSNILDIQSCGINNQRHFKEDKEQQQFLDRLFIELMKI